MHLTHKKKVKNTRSNYAHICAHTDFASMRAWASSVRSRRTTTEETTSSNPDPILLFFPSNPIPSWMADAATATIIITTGSI